MTLQECYGALKGNYEDAVKRLMNDRLVEKFMLKYPQDPSMQELRDALAAQDYDTAFRAVHTLKGVAANLGFTALFSAASDVTELLRSNRTAPDAEALRKLEDEYALVINTLNAYRNERG